MNKDDLYFKPPAFQLYGPLAERIINELNEVLTESLKEEGVSLDDNLLPSCFETLTSDMTFAPDLYVSVELYRDMGRYAEEHNL